MKIENAVEIQKAYQKLVSGEIPFTKHNLCELMCPLRDKNNLTDGQVLQVARNELSLEETALVLQSENERLQAENLELLEYGNQKYEDTINEFLDCLINAAAIPSCAADKFNGWYDYEIAATEKRVAKEFAEKIKSELNKLNNVPFIGITKRQRFIHDGMDQALADTIQIVEELAEQFGKED